MKRISVQDIQSWLLITLIAGAISYLLWKKGRITSRQAILLPALCLYLCFTLSVTLLHRAPARRYRAHMKLFWTYRAIRGGMTRLIPELLWNIILFIPIGLLYAAILPRWDWLAGVVGVLLSSGIELVQLFARRGTFEFDDIFHNTAGAFLGMLLYRLARRLRRRYHVEKRTKESGAEPEPPAQ